MEDGSGVLLPLPIIFHLEISENPPDMVRQFFPMGDNSKKIFLAWGFHILIILKQIPIKKILLAF